ncbi:uncharacterized protein LOC126260466 [Schistocerca nitens]|uniref:uncharacterized protein LOC126260466 n=1 Tax=Schistocerca nitens TaxID=7011 RepID=UPI002119B176|nr:uncharacterized protein LOC126260466 [Schistocerca nitens]
MPARGKSFIKSSDKVKALDEIRCLYFILSDCCRLVSRLYGTQNLVEIMSDFVSIATITYLSLDMWFQYPVNLLYPLTYNLLWLALCSARIVVVATSCEAVVRESDRTHELVSAVSVLSTCPGSSLAAEEEVEQLQLFEGQMARNPVSFKAAGVTRLGLPLLCRLFGAVSTCVVVLFQFSMRNI